MGTLVRDCAEAVLPRGGSSVQVGKGWHRPWTTQRDLSRAWEVGLYCQGLFAEEETSRSRIVTEPGLQMAVFE